jgi:predicted PurR-regulated permease PerM
MSNQIVNYKLTNGSIVRVLLWLSLAYSIFYFRDLILTLLVGLVIASTIDPIAKLMSKYKIPRVVTTASVFLILISSVLLIIIFVLPKLADDVAKIIFKLPSFLEEVRIFGKDFGFKDLSIYVSELSKNISQGQLLTVLKNSVVGAAGVAKTTGTVLSNLANFLLMLIFAFYLAVQDNGINNFLKLITPKFYENYILDLWKRSESKIGSWAKGQLIVGAIIAVIIYIPLAIIKLPYALLFAFLVFLGEMIPVVGLILASIPAIITAYFTGGMPMMLLVLGIFVVITQLENYVIYPKVMNSVIGVPAIVILISIIVGAKVAGFWGIVLAVPLAAIMMELVNDIFQEKIPSKDSTITIRYE